MARKKRTPVKRARPVKRLAQLSRDDVERRRVAVYGKMGDALADAGIIGWGTDERLDKGTHRAAYQAARLSLEAWSQGLAEGTESQRFTQYRGKLYPIITRKRDGKRVRGRKAISEETRKRSVGAVAYHARVRTIRDMLGVSYAEARKSHKGERGAWERAMWGGEKDEAVEAVKGPGVTFVDPTGAGPQTVPARVVLEQGPITRREETELKEAGLSLAQVRDLKQLRKESKRAEEKFKRIAEAAVEKRAKSRRRFEAKRRKRRRR